MRFLRSLLFLFLLGLICAAAACAQDTDTLTLLAENIAMPVTELGWNDDGTAVTVVSRDEVRQIALNEPDQPDVMTTDVKDAAFISGSNPETAAVLPKDGESVLLFKAGQDSPLEISLGFMPLSMSLAENGESLVVNDSGKIRALIYETKTGTLDKEMSGFSTAAPVYDTTLSQDGKYLVWHSRGTLQVQNTADQSLGGHVSLWDFISSYALSPDNSQLAAGIINEDYDSGVVIFYDPETGEETDRIALGKNAPYSLTYSADGSVLAAADADSVYLIDPETAGLLVSYTLGNSENDDIRISRMALSPDGRSAAVLMSDGELILIQ